MNIYIYIYIFEIYEREKFTLAGLHILRTRLVINNVIHNVIKKTHIIKINYIRNTVNI